MCSKLAPAEEDQLISKLKWEYGNVLLLCAGLCLPTLNQQIQHCLDFPLSTSFLFLFIQFPFLPLHAFLSLPLYYSFSLFAAAVLSDLILHRSQTPNRKSAASPIVSSILYRVPQYLRLICYCCSVTIYYLACHAHNRLRWFILI